MFGAGASFGVALAAFKYTGGLAGKEKPLDDQEVERREAERKMRRRPLSETIEQLGEGRGELLQVPLRRFKTNFCRYLCPGISGAETRPATGEVRRRCWPIPKADRVGIIVVACRGILSARHLIIEIQASSGLCTYATCFSIHQGHSSVKSDADQQIPARLDNISCAVNTASIDY